MKSNWGLELGERVKWLRYLFSVKVNGVAYTFTLLVTRGPAGGQRGINWYNLLLRSILIPLSFEGKLFKSIEGSKEMDSVID